MGFPCFFMSKLTSVEMITHEKPNKKISLDIPSNYTRTKLLSINNKKIVLPEHFLDFLPKIRLTIFGLFARIGVT